MSPCPGLLKSDKPRPETGPLTHQCGSGISSFETRTGDHLEINEIRRLLNRPKRLNLHVGSSSARL